MATFVFIYRGPLFVVAGIFGFIYQGRLFITAGTFGFTVYNVLPLLLVIFVVKGELISCALRWSSVF